MRKPRYLALASILLAATLGFSASAEARDHFRVCWSIYAGWMPWGYAAEQGIVAKWAKKYGIDIDVVLVNDYVGSIEQYAAGQFDGCTMTNMDALTIPAAAGIDTTALILGDFSNGNDGILIRGSAQRLQDLKGQEIHLVENSVSHYLLARALQSVHLEESDVKVVNVSDAELAARYAEGKIAAIATWNPILAEVQARKDSTLVFNSHRIPGEIIDMMVVNTDTLKANPALGRALTGAWFETMKLMGARNDTGSQARAQMARAAGTDLADYEDQLAKTRSFYSPRFAAGFASSASLPGTMERVAEFAFAHQLLGKNATSASSIGMSFANGVTTGNPSNIKLRFDPTYMQLAADGAL